MDFRLKRTPGVHLTGFMGSGKTTVGPLLAERLGWHFIDLDSEIENAEEATIARIFETRGEPEFRRIETETIRRLLRDIERGMPAVVALGGGAFLQAENLEILENHGISIWLDCSFDVISQRIANCNFRPLARDPESLRQLYAKRLPGYSKATYRIQAECSVEQAVEMILDLPCWK